MRCKRHMKLKYNRICFRKETNQCRILRKRTGCDRTCLVPVLDVEKMMFFWTPLPMKILVLRKKGYAALISRNSRRAQNPLHPSEGAFPYRNTQHHDVCVCVVIVCFCVCRRGQVGVLVDLIQLQGKHRQTRVHSFTLSFDSILNAAFPFNCEITKL